MSDYITQHGSGSSVSDIKLTDIYRYLQNPYAHLKQIRRASTYLTNKHGIFKDVLRTVQSLPTLKYHLLWSGDGSEKQKKRSETKAQQFLSDIEVTKFFRDGLYEVGELGTVVTCLRNDKYVQFLNLDDIRIEKQKNGKWIVEYDLKSIDSQKDIKAIKEMIDSLPSEVTLAKYNQYKNKGDDFRYVELSNCDVINIDAKRNFPYGLPFTIGAWPAILQKEIINRVERSVADRLIKQILILSHGTMDEKKERPAPKEVVTFTFNEVQKMLIKKDAGSRNSSNDTSGTGLITLPYFIDLKALKVDTELFKKDLYEKIDNEIFANLGVSPALVYGSKSEYASAQLNVEKFFRFILTIVDQFVNVVNGYLKKIIPSESGLTCKMVVERTTQLNKDTLTDKYKELYMQTGISRYWIESLTGLPYEDVLRQAKYEKEILKTEQTLFPPANAYTQSGKDGSVGRPEDDNSTNPNTIKSKTNGGNEAPSPSD